MADREPRWPRRHALCDCPERTDWIGGVDADPNTCRGGTVAHPILDTDAIAALLATTGRRQVNPEQFRRERLGNWTEEASRG